MVKSDALALERSILVKSVRNCTNANSLLIFILQKVIHQLHSYHLIKNSLRYDNGNTGLLIHVFFNSKIQADALTLERSVLMNTLSNDAKAT